MLSAVASAELAGGIGRTVREGNILRGFPRNQQASPPHHQIRERRDSRQPRKAGRSNGLRNLENIGAPPSDADEVMFLPTDTRSAYISTYEGTQGGTGLPIRSLIRDSH